MKDIIKMRSTLKLFVRDWAKEGEHERNLCYKPILEELTSYYKSITNKKEITVLIPGVGLARLLYEIAKLGFTAQGNEFSYFMLLSSNYMLNKVTKKEEFNIFPLIHTYSNLFWEKSPTKEFKIPDVISDEDFAGIECNMSMVAGEFVEVYKNKFGKKFK